MVRWEGFDSPPSHGAEEFDPPIEPRDEPPPFGAVRETV